MGRVNHIHLLDRSKTEPFEYDLSEPGKTPYWAERTTNIAVCGLEGFADYKWMRFCVDPAAVSCPACLKKMAKAKLAGRDPQAPRLRAEIDPEAKGGFRHQQGYKAFVGDELVGYLGYEDHHWRVYSLVLLHDGSVANDRAPLTESSRGRVDIMGRLPADTLHYPTRDDALLACAELRGLGRLKTAAELGQELRDAEQRWEEQQLKRRRARAQKEELRDATLAGLVSIRDELSLSNLQRAAIETAIERFTPHTAQDSD